LRQVERVDPLALTLDERTLMGLLGPPLITSPRAVKRLANGRRQPRHAPVQRPDRPGERPHRSELGDPDSVD
jgi:hypothetical protein